MLLHLHLSSEQVSGLNRSTAAQGMSDQSPGQDPATVRSLAAGETSALSLGDGAAAVGSEFEGASMAATRF